MNLPDPSQPKTLIIYGAGGHGLVILESALAAGWKPLGFYDDNPQIKSVEGWPVLDHDALQLPGAGELPGALPGPGVPGPGVPGILPGVLPGGVIVAIGNNTTRQKICEQLLQQGQALATVVHPSAWISPSARLSPGVFVGPQAVINARARVDSGAIVNTAAVIEHDCIVGPYAHLGPRSVLGARAFIGPRTLIGTGAAVRPDIRIGEDCTVGVGAAVVQPVPRGLTVVGVPAKPLQKR